MKRGLALFGALVVLFCVTTGSVEAQTRTVPFFISECNYECLEKIYPYAKLSQNAYKDDSSFNWNGWIRKDSFLINLVKAIDIIPAIKVINGLDMALYDNPARKEMVLAFRGTELLTDPGDRFTDITQAFGAIPLQYIEAAYITYFLQSKKPSGYRFIVTGHSLGGGIAQFIANLFGLTAYTFNTAPLGLSASTVSKLFGSFSNPAILNVVLKIKDYYWFGNDLIANLPGLLFGRSVYIPVNGMDSPIDLYDLHSIDNTVVPTIEQKLAIINIDLELGCKGLSPMISLDGIPIRIISGSNFHGETYFTDSDGSYKFLEFEGTYKLEGISTKSNIKVDATIGLYNYNPNYNEHKWYETNSFSGYFNSYLLDANTKTTTFWDSIKCDSYVRLYLPR